jgi:hypothetical protein
MNDLFPAQNHEELEALLRHRIEAQQATGVPLLDDLAEAQPEPTPEFTRELEAHLMQHWHEQYGEPLKEHPMTYAQKPKRKFGLPMLPDDLIQPEPSKRREARRSLAGVALLILIMFGTGVTALMTMSWRGGALSSLSDSHDVQPDRTADLYAADRTTEATPRVFMDLTMDPSLIIRGQSLTDFPTDPDSLVKAATDIVATVTQEAINLTATASRGFGVATATPVSSGADAVTIPAGWMTIGVPMYLIESTGGRVVQGGVVRLINADENSTVVDLALVVDQRQDVSGTFSQLYFATSGEDASRLVQVLTNSAPLRIEVLSESGLVPVITASREITAGTTLTADMLTQTYYPVEVVPPSYRSIEEAVGRVARYDTQLGSPVINGFISNAPPTAIPTIMETPCRASAFNTDTLTIRYAPRFTASVVATVPRETYVSVIEAINDNGTSWYRVTGTLNQSDIDGWVRVDEVLIEYDMGCELPLILGRERVSTPIPLVPTILATDIVATITQESLNLTATPVRGGENLPATIPPTFTMAPTLIPTAETLCRVVAINSTGTMVRARPTTNSAQLGFVPSNTAINVMEQLRGKDDAQVWYRVRVLVDQSEIFGWIVGDNTVPQTGEMCPPLPSSPSTVIVTATPLLTEGVQANATVDMDAIATLILVTVTQQALEFTATPLPVATEVSVITATPEVLCRGVTTNSDGVIVRARPTSDSARLALVPASTPTQVIQQTWGDGQVWYLTRVTLDEIEIFGWILMDNIVPENGSSCPPLPSTSTPTSTPEPLCQVMAVNAQGAIVRERPTIYAPQVGIVLENTILNVIEQRRSDDNGGVWYSVRMMIGQSEINGWIQWSDAIQQPESSCPAVLPIMIVTPEALCRAITSNPNGTFLRAQPTTASPQVAIIPPEIAVDIVEQTRSTNDGEIWYLIRTTVDASEIIGWLHADNVAQEMGWSCPLPPFPTPFARSPMLPPTPIPTSTPQ